MGFWKSAAGRVCMELSCADPSYALTLLQDKGITVESVRIMDDFTVWFEVAWLELKALRKLADKRGFDLKIVGHSGIYWLFQRLLRRPVLLIGVIILLILGSFLPTRVLFLEVEGNISLPAKQILEAAQQCGIGFGASRAEVRSEKMKNALLEAMPQLQWAGINTSGCTAVISVKERQIKEQAEQNRAVASIVASRDGIITSVTSTKGNRLCRIGQAVKAGQILISGYTDCGLSIRAVRAEGEVYAQTERKLTVITPVDRVQRGEQVALEKKYALIIGKNRINLYFGSGILDGSCVKMYVENYLTLPGGFRLPVVLVTEYWSQSENSNRSVEESQMLSDAADRYLTAEMVAGQIISAREETYEEDGLLVLQGQYACLEMIGQIREEEIVKPNGTND